MACSRKFADIWVSTWLLRDSWPENVENLWPLTDDRRRALKLSTGRSRVRATTEQPPSWQGFGLVRTRTAFTLPAVNRYPESEPIYNISVSERRREGLGAQLTVKLITAMLSVQINCQNWSINWSKSSQVRLNLNQKQPDLLEVMEETTSSGSRWYIQLR